MRFGLWLLRSSEMGRRLLLLWLACGVLIAARVAFDAESSLAKRVWKLLADGVLDAGPSGYISSERIAEDIGATVAEVEQLVRADSGIFGKAQNAQPPQSCLSEGEGFVNGHIFYEGAGLRGYQSAENIPEGDPFLQLVEDEFLCSSYFESCYSASTQQEWLQVMLNTMPNRWDICEATTADLGLLLQLWHMALHRQQQHRMYGAARHPRLPLSFQGDHFAFVNTDELAALRYPRLSYVAQCTRDCAVEAYELLKGFLLAPQHLQQEAVLKVPSPQHPLAGVQCKTLAATVSLDDFLWAYAALRSRHYILGGTHCMVPEFDLVNHVHSSVANTKLGLERDASKNNRLVLSSIATQDIAVGDTMGIDYLNATLGSLENFLITFGFVPRDGGPIGVTVDVRLPPFAAWSTTPRARGNLVLVA